MLAAYSAEECAAALAGRAGPGYEITVDAVGGTGPWTYAPPVGGSYPQANATTVTIRLNGAGEPQDGHLVQLDGEWRWFTVCADA